LARAKLTPADIAHFCMPSTVPRAANAVAKAAGIAEAAIADNLQAGCGDSGVAHPLLMLVAALEKAKAGERILVVGFGQGADVLLFEVCAPLPRAAGRMGVAGSLARRREQPHYLKFLAFNDIIEIERGMRAEV